LWDEA
jgi:uncharacterized phage infection (PIP) family protein YhgE